MNRQTIKKLHVKDTVIFAVKHVPETNQATLEKFLELVNTDGNYGYISQEQLLTKIGLALRYVPNVCLNSLLVVTDLLDVSLPLLTDDQAQAPFPELAVKVRPEKSAKWLASHAA